MELYNGRPDSVEGRLPREVRTYDFLDKLNIEYQRADHELANNMEALNEFGIESEKKERKNYIQDDQNCLSSYE